MMKDINGTRGEALRRARVGEHEERYVLAHGANDDSHGATGVDGVHECWLHQFVRVVLQQKPTHLYIGPICRGRTGFVQNDRPVQHLQ